MSLCLYALLLLSAGPLVHGYCNWGPDGTAATSVCNGEAQGGDWCNQQQSQCETCGGRWCSSSSQGYCNYGPDGTGSSSTCNGQVQGGDWCNIGQSNCNTCNGRWCTQNSGNPAPAPPPPPSGGQQVASTTRYWDCSGGACGCAYLPFGNSANPSHCYSNALFRAPAGNPYGATFYGAAAVSEALGGGYWLSEACGRCWKVTGTSNIPGTPTMSTTLVLKGTNFCPPSNAACSNGRAHFDIAAPGFDFGGASQANTCNSVEPAEIAGFTSCGFWMINSQNPNENCDCSLFNNDVLQTGCNNFRSLNWDNPDVVYEVVSCPQELSRLPCWAENGNNYPNGFPALCANPN